jgi:hypothetical protein
MSEINIYSLDKKEKISKLCEKSLHEKWFRTSQYTIMSRCPFCEDCDTECKFCLCPTEICSNQGEEGFINILVTKYGSGIKVCNIKYNELKCIQKLFKNYIL